MKKIICLSILSLMLLACNKANNSNENKREINQLPNYSFEKGSLENWVIDGDSPEVSDLDNIGEHEVPILKDGDYFLDGSETETFTATSKSILIEKDMSLSFKLGGYSSILYICDSKSGDQLFKFTNTEYINSVNGNLKYGHRGYNLNPYYFDLSSLEGKEINIVLAKEFEGNAYFDDIKFFTTGEIDEKSYVTYPKTEKYDEGKIYYKKALDNVLETMIGGFLGSSVTRGVNIPTSFVEHLSTRNPYLTYEKSAVNGTTLYDNGADSYYQRLTKMKKHNYDFFVVQLSTNDASKNYPISQTETAIRNIVSYIDENFGCPILFYTNPLYTQNVYSQMVTMLLRIKDELNINVLDMYHDEAINNMSATERSKYMIDAIHPTVLGYQELFTCRFERSILSMVEA